MNINDNHKTTIEFFSEFAELSNRKIYFSEQCYPGNVLHPVNLHKRYFYVPNTADELSFLVGFSDPKSLNSKDLFFGVFFPIVIDKSKHILIREKNIIDRLNPFFNKRTIKSNSGSFNSSVAILGNDIDLVKTYFNLNLVQNLILQSLKIEEAMYIGINGFDLNFVPAFTNKSNFGLYTRQKWIIETNKIEALFSLIEQFRLLLT